MDDRNVLLRKGTEVRVPGVGDNGYEQVGVFECAVHRPERAHRMPHDRPLHPVLYDAEPVLGEREDLLEQMCRFS